MKINNEILTHVIDIKERISGVEEHLKTLNSKVATNVKNIELNRCGTEKINLKLAKWGGGITVLFVLVQLGLHYFL